MADVLTHGIGRSVAWPEHCSASRKSNCISDRLTSGRNLSGIRRIPNDNIWLVLEGRRDCTDNVVAEEEKHDS